MYMGYGPAPLSGGVWSQTAQTDQMHRYEPPDTVPQAGPVIMDINLSFFPFFFAQAPHHAHPMSVEDN